MRTEKSEWREKGAVTGEITVLVETFFLTA